ncbi:PKS-NRPS hybrid synthetase [Glycine max]|nr:PKS-NRPS hybrid synthetase [Glycine max]
MLWIIGLISKFLMWLYDNLNVLVYDAYVLKMDEDQWRYDFAMSQEVHMDYDYDNQEECGVNEPHVFATRDDVLQWARTVAHENGFVAVIMRSDTEIGSRGRSSFVLIGCERSGTYKCRNKEFVRKDTGSRKCGCPFRLRGKPVHGGEGWMVKLICGIHNHELAKSLVGHPYAGRLTKEEKKIIADMTKSMVKPKNILLTLKEHNADSCTTIKQIYNAGSAYRSSIRGVDTEMQHLMKLLERDQYIHWHRLKDEVVVRDLFWCHPDAVKLCNACHLVFFIDSTYKTNRYRLPLLDFVGMTPTAMTFSAGFAYLEAERVNNIVWALERFRGLFLRNDRLPLVIVTDRDLALMNAVKTVFPESTNLLCRFHIDKNVKAKCKSLIGEKNVWDYVMDNWGTLVDCPSEHKLHESHQKFQVACSPWPMFIDYVNDTWIIPHKEKFITSWTNKVMHLGNTTTNRVESAHWALKRVLQNSVGDLCSVWDAMNNMITLQHVEIKTSFETSTHVVGHVYKKTLYKRLLRMVSRDALNQIASEVDRLRYLDNNLSSCGCVMRSTHGLPCACELSRYTTGNIPLESVHLFWRRLCFSDQGLCETEVTIKEEIVIISKRFDELDVAGKVTLKSKLREIAYPDHNSMCPPPSKVNTKGAPKKPMQRSQRSTKRDPSYWEYVDVFHSVQSSNSPVKRSASCSQPPQPTRIIPMLDQFASFFQGFIRDVVDVKADGNYGYRSIAALLGMGENSWPLVRNELIKEVGKWSHEYMNLFSGTERFEQLKLSLLVDGFSKVSVDKWMDITDMAYVIASRYNVILVSLSQQQSMTFFPLRSQPPPDSSGHLIICVGHVFGNHFVQAKQWAIPYISRMQQYTSLMSFKTHYMDEDEWMYEIMSERADMDYENVESCGANEPHVDCSDAFKTSQVFECREDVLRWAQSVAHENGFVAVILRSDTNTGSRGRTTFVLIGCERSGEYKCRKKEFIRRDTGTRKCGCPFKLRCKLVVGGEGWMVKLICGVHNHELAKSLVGHPYAGRLTKAEKILIADMTKSMVKPRNILLTLKEHNANSCTTIKQIYNARSAFCSSIKGSDLEKQHLMKLLEHDQYIHWHRIKDKDMVHDIFWGHPDSVKLVNACNLMFLIDNTYKTNRYRLTLLDFVGVTSTGMTFSAGFSYVEGECINNLVWALQRFRGLFLKPDALPRVIVTHKDQAFMNVVKDVFPECTNLLCIFHINKNVKAKCKSLITQKNAWDYVMDCWGSLTDCPSEQQFNECLKKFEIACAPWPMFVDYVKETWIIPHKEKFVSA